MYYSRFFKAIQKDLQLRKTQTIKADENLWPLSNHLQVKFKSWLFQTVLDNKKKPSLKHRHSPSQNKYPYMQHLHQTGAFGYVRIWYMDTWFVHVLVYTSGKVNTLQQKPKPQLHFPPPPCLSLYLPHFLAWRQIPYYFPLITIRTRYRIQVLEVRHCDLETLKLCLDTTNIGIKFERTSVQPSFDLERGRLLPQSK